MRCPRTLGMQGANRGGVGSAIKNARSTIGTRPTVYLEGGLGRRGGVQAMPGREPLCVGRLVSGDASSSRCHGLNGWEAMEAGRRRAYGFEKLHVSEHCGVSRTMLSLGGSRSSRRRERSSDLYEHTCLYLYLPNGRCRYCSAGQITTKSNRRHVRFWPRNYVQPLASVLASTNAVHVDVRSH